MVECARLESAYTARYRGFESLSLRQCDNHTPQDAVRAAAPLYDTLPADLVDDVGEAGVVDGVAGEGFVGQGETFGVTIR